MGKAVIGRVLPQRQKLHTVITRGHPYLVTEGREREFRPSSCSLGQEGNAFHRTREDVGT